eukprot:UN07528
MTSAFQQESFPLVYLQQLGKRSAENSTILHTFMFDTYF